jgi:hypothetical protein
MTVIIILFSSSSCDSPVSEFGTSYAKKFKVKKEITHDRR